VRAAILHRLGDRPRCEDVPEPTPGEGHELVRVTACPVTHLDRTRAAGTHYAAHVALPAVCGSIAAGTLADGTRVLFGSPGGGGTMAERAVTKRAAYSPIPDCVDDALAAAIQNPGVSAWNALEWRAKLREGERVLILGATGVTGQLAVQIARHLGAGRIVAAGRNSQVLASLEEFGADATIQLDQPDDSLGKALRAEAGDAGFDVVLDYLWGRPTEVLLSTLAGTDMKLRFSRTRLIQLGVMAGAHVNLPAEVLRGSGLEILGSGTGNAPPMEMLARLHQQVMDLLSRGKLRIEINRVPLADVEHVWDRDQRGRRTVLIP
jgi:NADPH2:quinone reductase